MEGFPLLHRQPAGAFLIFRRDAQRVAARRPEPTVYVEPLRRRSSCRSRWPGSLSRAAVIEFRHRSRGFRAGRDCRRNSATPLGPGPQARRTLATFLLWKVARPQAEHPPKKPNRGFAAAAASSFCGDAKGTKKSPGVSFVRKVLRLRLALSLTYPTPSVPSGHLPLSGGNVERSETKGVGIIRNPPFPKRLFGDFLSAQKVTRPQAKLPQSAA